jgi:hypothetical protein
MDEDFAFRIESRLTSHGVYVDEVRESDEGYELGYESISTDSEGIVPHREVGRVVNVFRDLHEDDWKGADIRAEVRDLEGDPVGRWHVEQAWLDDLHNGDLSEVEFSEKVVATIEPAGER